MSLSSSEVIEFCKTLSPGDRVKGIQHTRVFCTIVPNEWYTVKNIEVRPFYWDNKDGEEVLIVVEELPDNKISPYWFGICDAGSQVLTAERNNHIMKIDNNDKVKNFLPVTDYYQQRTKTLFFLKQLIRQTFSWAIVEPFKKTLQLAVFGGILFTGYKTVTDPAFFLKLLPKVQIEIGDQEN